MNKVYISIIRSQLSVREKINGWLDISEKKSVRKLLMVVCCGLKMYGISDSEIESLFTPLHPPSPLHLKC